MATVKELRAKFTAQAEGMKAVARSVKKDLQSIGDTTDKSVKRVNNGFGDLNKSLTSLDKNLQKVGDTKGFEDLNKSLRKVRTELSSTGKISAESMKELQTSVSKAKDHFVSLGDEGKVGLSRLGSSIRRVDAQLGSIDFDSLSDEVGDLNDELGDTNEKLGDTKKQVSDTEDSMDKLRQTVSDVTVVTRALRMSLVGLVPAASPAIASLTTATMGLASSFAAAGVGVVGFGAVAVSVLGQVFEASEEVAKLEEKIANADSAEERIAAQKELAAVYDDMSEAQRGALKELQNFKSFWSDFTKQFEEPIFSSFGEGLALAKNVLNGLTPTIDSVAVLINDLLKDMNNAVIAGGLQGFFEWLEVNAADALYNFARITGNTFKGFFSLLQAFAPIGASMENGLVRLTEKFANWAVSLDPSKGSFKQFIDYAMRNGPTLLGILGDLVKILVNAGILLAPVGELMLEILKGITGFITRLTDGAIALMKWEGLQPVFTKISDGIKTAKDSLGTFKEFLEGVFALVKGDSDEGTSILEKLGLSAAQVQQVINAVNLIKQFINGFIQSTIARFQMMSQFIMQAWGIIWPYLQPLLLNIVSFVGGIVSQITQFWRENGSQIMQAVQNCFNFILSIIKFVMPAVFFIIDMVWSSIKGVIQGALNIIMGLIKIFAGIFTGDFSKMWEGVKQLFKGAIQFVWNLISLLFIGRILKGISGFIAAAKNFFKKLWDDTLNIFKNLDKSVSNVVSKFIGYLKNSWNTAKNNAVSIFTNMKNTISGVWDDIVKGAKELPGKIGSGIKSMAGKATDGIKSLAQKMVDKLALGVNGVIGGVNWVMGKVGVGTRIDPWTPPEYKKGTDGHPGGPAILGDGKKKELFITPDGKMGMSPATDTLMNLPKGTKVLSGENTQKLMSSGIPAYKEGNIGLSDLWSLITSPSKLFNKILGSFGVEVPDFPGILKDFGTGIFNKVKDGFLSFLKDKLPDFNFGGNVSGNIKQWIAQAIATTGVPGSWAGPLATIAQHESGGNPNAINNWDINAQRGIPSMGLMQTIGPTFNAYKMSGFNDILNPVHNAIAAIRYIQSRYGNAFNVPGIRSMAQGGPYKGYFEGARVAVKQLAWVAEKGAEYIIPTDGSQRALDLWYQAGQEIGAFDTYSDNNRLSNNNRPSEEDIHITIHPSPLIVEGKELSRVTWKHDVEHQNQDKRLKKRNIKGKVR